MPRPSLALDAQWLLCGSQNSFDNNLLKWSLGWLYLQDQSESGLVSPSQDILQWKNARTFLYWRLRRLLLEEVVKAEILSAHSELSNNHIQSMLRRWFLETEGAVKVWVSSHELYGLGWVNHPCWDLGFGDHAQNPKVEGKGLMFPNNKIKFFVSAFQEPWKLQ